MLREAGAAEVHFRVSSPPYKWPCFYGLDTGRRSELLAADLSVGEIRDFLGVDSLAYLDLDRLIARHRARRRARSAPRACRASTRSRCPARAAETDSKLVLELEPGSHDVPDRRSRRRPSSERGRVTASDVERRAEPLTYAGAGVDIGAGEHAVELIKEHVRSTFRPEVVGDIGGFGGLFAFEPPRHPRPGARVVHRRRGHEVADRAA